jgi:hypothetical protein
MGADPADYNLGRIGSAGFPWQLLACPYRLRTMGAGNGCARIHHSGCGRDHGAATSQAFGVRALYRGLWSLLVHRQRDYGKALRRLHLLVNHLLGCRSNSCNSGIHDCEEAILDVFG